VPHHKHPTSSNLIANNPQQFRRRPEDVRRFQLRAPRDQNLHVSVGVAVQVAERGRSGSRLRSVFPADSSDQFVCEDEEEGGVAE
jgi:hypothetical protein